MYDTVCKDLGKTYPEVRNMHPGVVQWHYHHAVRRKIEENENKNLEYEFYMSVINPAMYKEYMKNKSAEEYSVSSFKENMSEEDFLNAVKTAHEYFDPKSLEEARKAKRQDGALPMATVHHAPMPKKQPQPTPPPPSPSPNPVIVDNHPIFDARNPATWKRPPGVPQMRQTGQPNPEDNDGDENPVYFGPKI